MSQKFPTQMELAACETEPIRYPGAVQPQGALLVVDPSQRLLVAASASCSEVLGRNAEQLVGRLLSEILGAPAALEVLAEDAIDNGRLVDVSLPGRPLVARASRNNQSLILIDVERGLQHAPALQQECRRLAKALRLLDDEAELAHAAAHGIRVPSQALIG